MTNQATAEVPDPAELERRFVEGDDVSLDDIENAKRQSRWARLKQQREQRQAERDAEAARVAEAEAFKARIGGKLMPEQERNLAELYKAAQGAVAALVDAADERNATIEEVRRRFSSHDTHVETGNVRKRIDGIDGFVYQRGAEPYVEVDGQRFPSVVIDDAIAGAVIAALKSRGRKGGAESGPITRNVGYGANNAHKRFAGEDL